MADAWNESIAEVVIPDIVRPPVLRTSDTDGVTARETTVDVQPIPEKDDPRATERNTEILELLVEHLKELRREETQRSAVYIIIASLMFGMLFLYIDRLQCRVQQLALSIETPYRWSHAQRDAMSITSVR